MIIITIIIYFRQSIQQLKEQQKQQQSKQKRFDSLENFLFVSLFTICVSQ